MAAGSVDTRHARRVLVGANESQPPSKAEVERWAIHLESKAVIADKHLDIRHKPVLVIKQGTLLAEEIDWGNTFFSATATKESFAISSHEDYMTLEQQSLVAHAQIGDSLLKHAGDSTAVLKRGQQLRVFYFHNLWP